MAVTTLAPTTLERRPRHLRLVPAPQAPTTHPDAVEVVPLRPGQAYLVQEIFDGLSVRSRFLRFHTGVPHLRERMLRELAEVVPGRKVSHVALRAGRPVGQVRWVRDPDHPAEADLAIEVVDDAQGHGVSRLLLAAAARSAVAAGVGTFQALVAAHENSWLHRRALALGAQAGADRDDLRLPAAALLDLAAEASAP